MLCHACKKDIKVEGFVSRTDDCPNCGADIHACLNCEQYDPSAHNRCREPQSEWVTDREKANFCDFFAPNKKTATGRQAGAGEKDVRSAFDNLFKK